MQHQQHEIKIVVFTSRMDGTFVADIYYGSIRVHCGGGPIGQTYTQAYDGALKWLDSVDGRVVLDHLIRTNSKTE